MKDITISLKIDSELAKVLDRVPNKSEFIRKALLESVEKKCPVCNGKGHVGNDKHMREFFEHHSIEKCPDCSGIIIQCK